MMASNISEIIDHVIRAVDRRLNFPPGGDYSLLHCTHLGTRVTVGGPAVRVSAGEVEHGVLLLDTEPGVEVCALLHVLETAPSLVGGVRVPLVVQRLAHHQDVVSSPEGISAELTVATNLTGAIGLM